jgi:phosphoglycolate phosphatase
LSHSGAECRPRPNPVGRFAVDAILFDLDGTLVDTAPDLAGAVNRVLRDFGGAPRDEAFVRNAIGDGARCLVRRALTSGSGSHPSDAEVDSAYARFLHYYGQCVCNASRPYAGVPQVLERLGADGFALACVTNKSEGFARPLLEQLDLLRYFPILTGGDTYPVKKPEPLPLLETCRLLGVPAAEALLVGDSATDVAAARAAGIPVVCVSYGYNGGADVAGLKPDAVVDDFAAIVPLLCRPERSVPSARTRVPID